MNAVLKRLRPHAGLVVVLLVFACFSFGATKHTSTTFDEILTASSGARGWSYPGRYSVHLAHPPLAQYSYGYPIVPWVETYPDMVADWPSTDPYGYARALFGELGNPTETLARVARFPAMLWGCLGILVVYFGCGGVRRGGLFAAAFLAFLPDYLAHSGIAYNDVILACTLPLGLLAGDRFVRNPTARSAGFAGACIGLALGTKFSAVLLGPLGLAVVVLETCARRERAGYLRELGKFSALALGVTYATLVLLERGDVTLELWRDGLAWSINPVLPRVMPSYLFGELRPGTGLFYVVAYAVKLPLAAHALIALGMLRFLRARARTRTTWRRWLRASWRAPLLGVLLFALVFARSEANNGLRYALPAFPLLALLLGPHWARAWRHARSATRWAWGGLWAAAIVVSLAAYPHFIGFMNVLIPADQRRWVLAESSLDWGQGLIELRTFMQREGYPAVHLAHFGSAAPAAYGIAYRPLPSFLDIPTLPGVPEGPLPVAISATLLNGFYVPGDLYAAYREEEPIAVLAGGSLFVYAPRAEPLR